MADTTSAMAADSDARDDKNHSEPFVNDTDVEDQSAEDDIAVWSRYSAHLDDAWDYDHDEADHLPSLEQRSDPNETDHYDYEDLVLAFGDELSEEDLSVFRHSSGSSAALSKHSLDGNGNGSDLSSERSLRARSSEPHPSFTFPIREPSLRPRTASSTVKNASRCISDPLSSNQSHHHEANMARDDESFWAVTASLLGPDFDFNATTIKDEVKTAIAPELQRKTRANALLLSISKPQSDASRGGLLPRPLLPRMQTDTSRVSMSLHETLTSLGQTWYLFTSAWSLQAYIDTLKHSHDFGVCFLDQDGSRCCCIMRARQDKRIYSLPASQYWSSQDSSPEFPDPGCKPTFWWCLPFSPSTDPDATLVETRKEMERRYETAKLLIAASRNNTIKTKTVKRELDVVYRRLLLDLPVREKLTGRFSIEAMNTVLQLGELAEASTMFTEAEKWNRELVSRSARRLGRKSEHTCQARYKLSSLLLQIGEFESARDVCRENLQSLHEEPVTKSLVVRQNVLACMIAMKRRRLDQAMEVLPHLWTLERWHEHDLRTKDEALCVLVQACLFRHQFAEAEGWIKKRIDLFDGLEDVKPAFGDKQHRASVYQELAICLNKQDQVEAAVEAAKSALRLYKISEDVEKYDETVSGLYNLLGKLYFDLKEWNRARFYLEKAAHGYTAKLGSRDEKSIKARELLKVLEKSMRIRQGLAERLVKEREKAKLKKKY